MNTFNKTAIFLGLLMITAFLKEPELIEKYPIFALIVLPPYPI